ncbi:MAG TPA: hypothetical protein PK199_00055 [Bacteroidales bacterium]|nr:hypothetical protein [Bacteroidales bacterium]
MKIQVLLIVSLIVFTTACHKEGLDVKFRTMYGSGLLKKLQVKSESTSESMYEQYYEYGDFIQYISPSKVTAKFNSIRYVDRKESQAGMQTMVDVISVNWPSDDARRFADFTNGSTVEVIPQMWGNIDNDGWFVEDTIRLRYLLILPDAFKFEFDYPAELPMYEYNTWPNIFKRTGNTVICDMHYLLQRTQHQAYDYEYGIFLKGFVFGGTDTSFIATQSQSAADIFDLISMAQPHSVARSGNYECPILTPPVKRQSKIITTYITFNSENIIQHYAGYDNIAYTSDDMFVLEPKFWDRFDVIIEQN